MATSERGREGVCISLVGKNPDDFEKKKFLKKYLVEKIFSFLESSETHFDLVASKIGANRQLPKIF